MAQHTAEIGLGTPSAICAFALHRGRYCMRPAGHEKTDGRVPRHDSTQAWIDRYDDVWTLGDDGLLHSFETAPFPREHVEKKWGPLRPTAVTSPAVTEGGDH